MISIIGSGKVGSAVTFLVSSLGLDDVILVNRTKNKAIGEALDLSNTIPEDSSISITGTDDFAETQNSEIVVITASTATYTTSRTEILHDQYAMINDIRKNLEKYTPDAKILMISNPLDVLTYVFQKQGSFSSDKVIGIASSLDASRFQLLLAQELQSKTSEITDAMVLGEHGDTMVPIFSRAKLNGTPVLEKLNDIQIKKIKDEVRNYWKTLREFKSRSVFGISSKVYSVIDAMLNQKEISIPSSVLLNGEFGESDVCMGVPTRINKDGLAEIQEIKLNSYEEESLHYSAEVIRKYIQLCK